MHTRKQNWLVWLIPLTLCLGIVLGALLGMSFTLDSVSSEGPEGDMSGAAAALMIVICVLVGFPSSMFTIVITRIMRRPVPQNMSIPFGLSLFGGGVIGGLTSIVPAEHFIIAWLILVLGSILVTWLSAR